ncbi:TonB-dependent receptor, partial [Microcystis aeruginosa EAWAG127a]
MKRTATTSRRKYGCARRPSARSAGPWARSTSSRATISRATTRPSRTDASCRTARQPSRCARSRIARSSPASSTTFNEQWTATAEFRHAEEDKEQLSFAFPTNGTSRVAAAPLNGTWKSNKPRFTLRYKLSDDVSFFANYAEGNKPGGFNSATVAPLLSAIGRGLDYDEEESVNYELGAKFRLLDQRAFATVTLFDTELTDQQLTQNIAGQNAAGQVILNSYIDNVGKTNSRGVELEFTSRLTERFDLSFGAAYVDATIKEYVNVDQADLYSNRPAALFTQVSAMNPTGCANAAACQAIRDLDNAQFGSVAGKRTPRSPEWNGFVLASTRSRSPTAWPSRSVVTWSMRVRSSRRSTTGRDGRSHVPERAHRPGVGQLDRAAVG